MKAEQRFCQWCRKRLPSGRFERLWHMCEACIEWRISEVEFLLGTDTMESIAVRLRFNSARAMEDWLRKMRAGGVLARVEAEKPSHVAA